MAEQLALQQRVGQRAHVHGNERLVATWAESMYTARDKLLAGAALTFDQHRARHRRDLFDLYQNFAQRFGVAAQSRLLTQPTAFQLPTHHRCNILGTYRLHQNVGVADAAQAFVHARLVDIGQTDDWNASPELFAHDLHIASVEQCAGDHDHVGLETLQRTADVVQRRDQLGLDAGLFQQRVEPHRRFDIGERDECLHDAVTSLPIRLARTAVLRPSQVSCCHEFQH